MTLTANDDAVIADLIAEGSLERLLAAARAGTLGELLDLARRAGMGAGDTRPAPLIAVDDEEEDEDEEDEPQPEPQPEAPDDPDEIDETDEWDEEVDADDEDRRPPVFEIDETDEWDEEVDDDEDRRPPVFDLDDERLGEHVRLGPDELPFTVRPRPRCVIRHWWDREETRCIDCGAEHPRLDEERRAQAAMAVYRAERVKRRTGTYWKLPPIAHSGLQPDAGFMATSLAMCISGFQHRSLVRVLDGVDFDPWQRADWERSRFRTHFNHE